MTEKLSSNFQEIVIETPVDKIIRQIRSLLTSGQLNPGDRLPSERKLAEKLGVGRSHVRDAIRKLEFYGILKTLPQSGTSPMEMITERVDDIPLLIEELQKSQLPKYLDQYFPGNGNWTGLSGGKVTAGFLTYYPVGITA